MSRQVLFLHTAHQDERTFLLKDYEYLQQMDPDSHDIQSHQPIDWIAKETKISWKYSK